MSRKESVAHDPSDPSARFAGTSPSRTPRWGGARVAGGGVMGTDDDAHDPSVAV